MESLIDFKKRVRRVTTHKKHKIRNSLGIYDGYKYYRKNKPKEKKYVLTESQYFAITRQINNILANELVLGNDIKLPQKMGSIEIRKYDKSVRIGKDGKVITNLPIDWEATLELWYNDKEAYNNKILLRMDVDEIYKIYYNKNNANYNNVSFYEFTFNRDIKIRLKQNIKKGIIDALYLGRRTNYVDRV